MGFSAHFLIDRIFFLLYFKFKNKIKMDLDDLKIWLSTHDIKTLLIPDEKEADISQPLIEFILDNFDRNFTDIWNYLNSIDLPIDVPIPPLLIAILLYNYRITTGYSPKDAFKDLSTRFGRFEKFIKIKDQFPELNLEEPIPTSIEESTDIKNIDWYSINPRNIPIDLDNGSTDLYTLISNYKDAQEATVLTTIGVPIQLILLIWYATHGEIILANYWNSEQEFINEYNQYITRFNEASSKIESEEGEVKSPQNVISSTLDSEITLSYKYAKYFGIPTRFIYKRDNQYRSIYEDFKVYNGTLEELYSQLSEIKSDLSIIDIANLYYNAININSVINDAQLAEINTFLSTEYTLPELIENYNQWQNKLIIENEETTRIADRITEIQKSLTNIKAEAVESAFKFNEMTLIFNPIDINSGKNISPIYGINIFNNAIPNSIMPYLTYIDGIRKITKLYNGKILDSNNNIVRSNPNYDFIIPEYTIMNDPYSIYFQLWVDQKGEPGKTSYKLIKYDLKKNELTIPFRQNLVKDQRVDISDKIKPLSINFPSLDFSKYTIKSIDGEVDIYNENNGIKINPTSLLHLILLDSRFNTYLYVSEVSAPAGAGQSLVLRYNSYLDREIRTEKSVASNLTITITQQIGKQGIKYHILQENPQTKKIEKIEKIFTSDTYYIKLAINNAKNAIIIKQFLDVFKRLLQIYFDQNTSIENIYDALLTKAPSVSTVSSRSSSTSNTSLNTSLGTSMNSLRIASSRPSISSEGKRDKLRELQLYKVFKEAKNYSRFCQQKLTPIVILPEDKESWEKRTYRDKDNKLVNLKVLEFYTKEGLIYIGCDPETYDTNGVRKAEPYFKKNNYTSNKDEYPLLPCCGSKRQEYKSNLELQSNINLELPTETSKIKTSGALEMGNTGNLSESLERFLKTFHPDSMQIRRKGVIDDSNNLIHCILTATDKNYNNVLKEDKIKIATAKRSEILKKFSPLLCKAELYDYTVGEIKNTLEKDKLNPELHYRILEEAFDINIWTFYEPTPNFQTLLIPRHKLFHSRIFDPNRDSILLFRSDTHFNNFSSSLIIDQRESQSYARFGRSMTTILYKLFLALHSHNFSTISRNKINTYANLCNLFNYRKLFANAEAQILDNYGKLKALLVPIDNQLATICVLPGAPLNLPLGEPTSIHYNSAIKIFKDLPIAATYENGKGVGLWYRAFDYESAFFVITKPWDTIIINNISLKLPEGAPDPLGKNYNNITNYRQVQKDARILFQLLEWVYTIGYVMNNGSWRTQFSNLLEVHSGNYNFEGIDYILPEINTIESAIQWLSNTVPTLIYKNKIRISSEILKFKILEKLREFDKGVDSLPGGPDIPEQMVQLYEYHSDFKRFPNIIIFLSFEEITKWRHSINTKLLNNIIYTELNSEISKLNYPIMYSTTDQRLWLIQNNITHTLNNALYISNYWNIHTINLGYNVDSGTEDFSNLGYTLYNVNIENKLFVVSVIGNGIHHIIQWTTDRYSSLLSIL
jgi:hypothetical protein